MKKSSLVLLPLLLPLVLDAKNPTVKGVLPELQLNKKTESENIKTAAGAEALISKSEQQALQKLEGLVKKFRGTQQEPDLVFRLAELYSRRAKTGRFVDLYRNDQNIISILPPAITAVGAKAYLAQSITQYSYLEKNYPQFAAMDEVLFNKAFAHEQRGESKEAIASFLKLLNNHPRSPLLPETHMALGELYFQSQNYTTSTEHYDQVLRWPKTRIAPIALYKSAWCSYNLKKTEEGLTKFERLLRESRNQNGTHVRAEARRDLALFYSEVGSVEGALPYLQKHLKPEEVGQTILDLSSIYERHGKLAEMDLVLSLFLKAVPNDSKAGLILSKRIDHQNEKKNISLVTSLIEQASELCTGDQWAPTSAETRQFCDESYPAELKDLAAQWWEQWNKINRDPRMTKQIGFIFTHYLRFEKPERWSIGVHASYADYLFSQNDFSKAAQEYELVTVRENVEPEVLHTSLYGTVLSLDRHLQSNPKDSVIREKLMTAINNYLERTPNGEYIDEVRYKKAFLFYEQKDYIQSLSWIQKIQSQSQIMRDKRDDLILEIHRSKKDYEALVKASYLIWKASTGERAVQIKTVYQGAQQAIIQQLISKNKLDKAANNARAFYSEHRPETKALEALHLAVELWEKIKVYRPAAENAEVLAQEMKAAGRLQDAETISQHASTLFLKLGDLRRATQSLPLAISLAQSSAKKKESLELLAEISSWFGDVNATEKAWNDLEPLMNNQEKEALLSKRLEYFTQYAPEKAKALKAQLVAKGLEPFYSDAQLATAQSQCEQKKLSLCYQAALKLSKETTPQPQRSHARALQAQVLAQEFYQQSLKATPERMAMVMAYKAEKFEKAVQVLNNLSQNSPVLTIRRQAVENLIALYNDYVTQLQNSMAKMDPNHAELQALKQEIQGILPVLSARPQELSVTLVELNKLIESEGKQVAVAATDKPFPELNGSELRVYVPSWEETSQYRPLAEVKVSAKSCEGQSWLKLKSLTSLGREANACLLKGRHSQLEAVALRLSDLHPDTPWGPFYLALSTATQKANERALWYLKLAQQRSSESILFYEEGRAAYALLPDAIFAAKLQKLEGPWAETEDSRFLVTLEKLKLKDCESAREEVQQLRSQYWRGTPVDRLVDDRCPLPTSTTVTKVDL